MANPAKFAVGVKNFRSVEFATLPLRRITVLTGSNGAGKSSFMYALIALRNVLANANQPVESFFNLGFTNLGGFKEVVTRKDTNRSIQIGASFSTDRVESSYIANIGASNGALRFTAKGPFELDLKLDVSFPYPLVQNASQLITWHDQRYKVTFNGVDLQIAGENAGKAPDELRGELGLAFRPVFVARACDYIDVKRGFFRNTYAAVPTGVSQNQEEEIAAILANDRDLEAKVSVILEKMVNKSFAVRQTVLGAATFYLQTIDRNTGFVCDLVNEGFGINQLVFLLAKILQKNRGLICIEEPETHLHPEALRKLTEQLVVIAKRENKSLLISSHSENFVVSLLNLVAQGRLSPDDVGIYFVAKDQDNLTTVAAQEINDKGQLEGGLKSFYEPSMRALEEFLGTENDKQNVNPSK